MDSGEVSLGQGINIITGKNNAGKTALLQALGQQFNNNPHKSALTMPTTLSVPERKSSVEIEICLYKTEIIEYLDNYFQELYLPQITGSDYRAYSPNRYIETILSEKNYIFGTINGGNEINSAQLKGLIHFDNSTNYKFSYNKHNRQLQYTGNITAPNSYIQLINLVKQRFYFFKAERLGIGVSTFGVNQILKSDASNLPEVLHFLQVDNRTLFDELNQHMKNVFPQIKHISTRPTNNSAVEIVVWNEEVTTQRSDLVIPITECGTGLGQVLAILYVVLTSKIPKVIFIDEPNSFLHPGASRKLIEILKGHPQHQFIISTHSPSMIAAANPSTINIVRTENTQSIIQSIDINETKTQQLYLAEIGSKLSDVFGADNILWVEGKTEEICFPKIIERTEGLSLMGTSIIGVKNTGDFQKNTPELIFGIYKKLSNGGGLMPSAVGFIFDKEKLNATKIDDLKRQSDNKVHFTNRRMFESYLLNPNAIFNVLNNIETIEDLNLTIDSVTEWLNTNKWLPKYSTSTIAREQNEINWVNNVDAAKLLNDMFSALTNSRVQFDKITHSVALTEWIIENSIEDLKEIQDLLINVLSDKQSQD